MSRRREKRARKLLARQENRISTHRFADGLQSYLTLPADLQDHVHTMARIINDSSVDDEEKQMAITTLQEILYPIDESHFMPGED